MRLQIIILFSMVTISFAQQNVKFAVIGDYGKAGTNELNVSNLVKNWNPELIITLGDNNYELGEASTIDTNIGKYYHEFIYPYYGSYGSGDTVNSFFPSLGNHDWYTNNAQPYFDYFTLPGNERYYDFIKGDVHFFALDSDPNEPDGVDSSSMQALWLKNALASSTQKWNIVYFHHAPYSSGEHGPELYMQWPFADWGATAVLAGHDHTYERLFIDNIYYFVNGLGGKSIYSFVNIMPGSQLRYNNNFGAMIVNSYNDSLVFMFYSVSGNRRDYHVVLPAAKELQLKVFNEGMYNESDDNLVSDTMRVYIHENFSPYNVVDSTASEVDSTGAGTFMFDNAAKATEYFIVVKHRNSMETWSSVPKKFTANNLSYNFTDSISKAFGENLVHVDNSPQSYALHSGDVNQNGSVDLTDIIIVYNDANSFLLGYVRSDVDGNNIVDLSDVIITYNSSNRFVVLIKP